MPNTIVIFAVISAVAWLSGTCTLPRAAYSADMAPTVNSNATGSPVSLETRRAPVPIVRKLTEPAPSPIPAVEAPLRPPDASDEPTSAAGSPELPALAELTGTAAKAAVEADGYKRVTVLGRKPNGIWRVKAYRGDTEVVITVDRTGTVTTE
jgi:hypothetical protein